MTDLTPTTTDIEPANDQPATKSVAAVVRDAIAQQADQFAAVLPKNIDRDRFERIIVTAVKANPRLLAAFDTTQGRVSIFVAAMQSAVVGLEPNTPTQEAWIIPQKNKGTDEAELRIGYRGYMKLAKANGKVQVIDARVVHQGDTFNYGFALDGDYLDHKVDMHAPQGERHVTHAYALVRWINGGSQFVVLTANDIDKRRAMSPAGEKGPWGSWSDEMARKSAIRALVPFLELSPEAMTLLDMEGRPLTANDLNVDNTPQLDQ